MRVLAGLLAILTVGCGSGAPTSTRSSPAPTVRASPSLPRQAEQPDARSNVAMAYDAARKVTVLFGGTPGNGQRFTDTWTWDGSSWTKQRPASSPALLNPGMAYDAARQRVVLFGTAAKLGEMASLPPGETWTWDGANWRRESPGTSPSARERPLMTYDTKRQLVIMFGGTGRVNEHLSTSWAWDGADWRKLSETITGISDGGTTGAMAYDPAVDRTVLYEFSDEEQSNRDMWLFDGSAWTKRPTGTTALPFDGHGLVYDSAINKLELFGGEDAGIPPQTRSVRSDMWSWDGTTWARQATTMAPTPRVYMGMVYDSEKRQILVFGGLTSVNGQDTPLNDTWTWDGANWTRRA